MILIHSEVWKGHFQLLSFKDEEAEITPTYPLKVTQVRYNFFLGVPSICLVADFLPLLLCWQSRGAQTVTSLPRQTSLLDHSAPSFKFIWDLSVLNRSSGRQHGSEPPCDGSHLPFWKPDQEADEHLCCWSLALGFLILPPG